MTLSYPTVHAVTANYDGSNTQVLILLQNSGGYGYVLLQALTGTTVKGSREGCFDIKTSPFNYKTFILLSGLVQPIDYIKAYQCNSDSQQNCSVTPPTCSQVNLTNNFNAGGVYPIAFNGTAPATPGGLIITPGNGSLNIKWNAVSDPGGPSEVFAYSVRVLQSGNTIVSGHVMPDNKNINITGLTNGVTYNVEIIAVSHSNVTGPAATGTGTPVAPCGTPSCTFRVI